MITPKLFAITFDYQDGGMSTIFSVEVDMDYATAVKRILETLNDDMFFKGDEYTEKDIEENCTIIWEQVPEVVDGHRINIERIEE